MANVALFFDKTGFGGTAGSDEAWAHVVAWEDSLPEDQYHTIHQLVANGWEDDLPGLEEDIRSAMEAEPPDPEVEATLNEFLSVLEDRGEDDSALAISLSEEPEQVVLDLPPMNGNISTANVECPESWEGVPVAHGEDPALNAWSDAARAASIEARRRSHAAVASTRASLPHSEAFGKDRYAGEEHGALDHLKDASWHRQVAESHNRVAGQTADPAQADALRDAAVGHEAAADMHETAARLKSSPATVDAKLASDRAFGGSTYKHASFAVAHVSALVERGSPPAKAAARQAHKKAVSDHEIAAKDSGNEQDKARHLDAAAAHRVALEALESIGPPRPRGGRRRRPSVGNEQSFIAGGVHEGNELIGNIRKKLPSQQLDITPEKACILPGQEVQGHISVASEARYVGEAVLLTVASGVRLAVTPNHPVLTPEGFVPAGNLHKGQHLLHYVREDKAPVAGMDIQYAPLLAEEVFKAWAALGTEVCQVTGLDFHGDAALFQGDVKIVRAISPLGDYGVAQAAQVLSEGCLGGEGKGQPLLARGGAAGKGPGVLCAPPPGVVGRTNHRGPLLTSKPLPPDLSGAGVVAADASPVQLAADDSCTYPVPSSQLSGGYTGAIVSDDGSDSLWSQAQAVAGHESTCCLGSGAQLDIPRPEPSLDDLFGDAHLARQLCERFPSQVSLDQIVNIERFHYSGPVYDFQSPLGYILTQGLVTSNCKILKDGEVRGHPLTERQRGLFGVICGRRRKQTANSELDSVTRNEGLEKLPSSAYAYVPHVHRPDTWKLRIDGPKHVSASIAALSKANIPKGELLGVKKKLRAAWRKFFPDKDVEEMPEVIRNVEYDQDDIDYELAIDELTQMVDDGDLPDGVFNMIPGAPGPMSEPAYSVGSGPQTASGISIKARDASREAHEASLRTSVAPLESRMALDAADRAVRHAQSGNQESAREEHRAARAAHLSASAHHKLVSTPGPVPAPDSGLVAQAESQMLPSISGVLATPLPTLEGDGTATRSVQSDLGTIIDMTGLASAHANASGLHQEAADLHADAYDELEPAPTSGITLPEDDEVTLSEDGTITLSEDESPGTLLSMWPNKARIATASSRRAHMATSAIEGVSKDSMKESAEAVSDADEAENASRDENLKGRSGHKNAMKAHESLAAYHKRQSDKASKTGNRGLANSHTTASQLHKEAAGAHADAYDEAAKPLSNEVYDPDLGRLIT